MRRSQHEATILKHLVAMLYAEPWPGTGQTQAFVYDLAERFTPQGELEPDLLLPFGEWSGSVGLNGR